MDCIKKVVWNDVRNAVSKIDNQLAKLIDDCSPDKNYPMYISSYNYGEQIGDHKGMILRDEKKGIYRLGDQNTPTDILKNLGYGATNAPMLMILDNVFEWEIYDEIHKITFPIYMEGPGYFVGIKKLLENNKRPQTYLSSSIMSCSAGAKNAFMLPKIGNQRNHMYLQNQLGLLCSAPTDMRDHWEVFQEISNSTKTKPWKAKALIFSEKWIQSLKKDPAWSLLNRYLVEKMLNNYSNEHNKFFFDFAFSRAQLKKNISQSPYLNETAKHVIGIAIGENLGFKPATTSNALPLNVVQQTYVEVYKLKKNPVIMIPAKYNIHSKSPEPVYYSLQRPIICSLEQQTKTETRAYANLLTLHRMITKYQDAFSCKDSNEHYQGTSLSKISKNTSFSFYHHKKQDNNSTMLHTSNLINEDIRFNLLKGNPSELPFSEEARFLRGCVKISKKID